MLPLHLPLPTSPTASFLLFFILGILILQHEISFFFTSRVLLSLFENERVGKTCLYRKLIILYVCYCLCSLFSRSIALLHIFSIFFRVYLSLPSPPSSSSFSTFLLIKQDMGCVSSRYFRLTLFFQPVHCVENNDNCWLTNILMSMKNYKFFYFCFCLAYFCNRCRVICTGKNEWV